MASPPRSTANLPKQPTFAFLTSIKLLSRNDGNGAATGRRRPKILQLLDFHFCASFFELLLGCIGVSLVCAFQQRLRSTFNQSFRFGQAQSRLHFTDDFDDGDLLVRRNGGEDHVKSVFGSRGRRSSATSSRSSRSRDGRSGGNAP